MISSLDNENKLLIACGRLQLTEKEKSTIINIINSNIEWKYLLILANHHKLMPLLYKHLKEINSNIIPIGIINHMNLYFNKNQLNNLIKYSVLISIVKIFNEHNIRCLAIKGPLFTIKYFGDISLRTFWDLDILVEEANFRKCSELLISSGFIYFPVGISKEYFFHFSNLNHHGQFISPEGIIVELHWELSGSYGNKLLNFDYIKPFFRNQQLDHYHFITVSTEFLVVYLALHAQRHLWQRYDYLVCLSEALKNSRNINWEEIFLLSTRLKIKRTLIFSLFLANKILDAPIDYDYVNKNRENLNLDLLVEETINNWNTVNFNVLSYIESEGAIWRNIYPNYLMKIDGFKNIAKHFYKQYFRPSPEDWSRLNLPYLMRGCYYIIRPSYKIYRFFKHLTKRFDHLFR